MTEACRSIALGSIVAGVVLWLAREESWADLAWAVGAAVVLVPLVVSTARSLLRGDVGVDAIALVAIVWALALGEFLAAAIVALMMSGGAALEAWAAGRARRELRLLVERAPRIAHRYVDGTVEEVKVDELLPGDVVVVRAGEVVPADGAVVGHEAVLDESALTGEALPVTIARYGHVRSGTANAGDAFDLRVTSSAAESAYAAIVRLVAGRRDRPRPVHPARRPLRRVLPALLARRRGHRLARLRRLEARPRRDGRRDAVPAHPRRADRVRRRALAGRSGRHHRQGRRRARAARRGEDRAARQDRHAHPGQPELERIVPLGDLDADEALRLAASLDQMSAHVLAESLVAGAGSTGHRARPPDGREGGPRHAASSASSTATASPSARAAGSRRTAMPAHTTTRGPTTPGDDAGRAKILVGVDGALAAVIVMGDRLRPGADTLAQELHDAGIAHVALVSGDRPEIADEVARNAGIEHVYAEQTPEEKLEVVRAVRGRPGLQNVVMVGDGINDAPALALADVGIAMAGKGATISSETADVVITVDDADRIALAILIGRRSLHIARQSVIYGLGLSVAAMVVAAFGYLPPVWGALFQEVIDVAVILNALRALRG